VAENSQNPVRNKAIILILLDTGIRASELCQIKIRDIDFENRRILIFGKGNKERSVPFSKISQKVIETYLELRKINIAKDRNTYLFITKDGKPLNRFGLLNMIERYSASANIYPGHPHRFRHTFSIQFLRNGGNIYTLQRILGHSTLDMVKKYLSLSQSDIDSDHELASPLKAWGLE
jgi:site-specific recombinase XerD